MKFLINYIATSNLLTAKALTAIAAATLLVATSAIVAPRVFNDSGPTDGLPAQEGMNAGKGDHSHGEVISGGSDSSYPVVTVQQPIKTTNSKLVIESAGQILAAQHADIYPRREGVVQSLNANLGDRVYKGQAVASLQPDKDQAELAAELAFKQKELEIAKERLTVSSETKQSIAELSLETSEKDQVARLKKIDAEIQAIKIKTAQNQIAVKNAAYDLIDTSTILMYTRTDAISRYDDYGPYDYYRRREIFYPRNDEAQAVELILLNLYQGLENDNFEDSLELISVAIDAASAVRRITSNASQEADFGDENVNQRAEINEVVDHLSELSTELVTSTSELSALEAEKQSIAAQGSQSLLEIKSEGQGSLLDIKLLEAEIERIRNQMGAARTVYAPFNGVITKRFVNVGDSVDLDKPLFTIIDDKNSFVRFFVTEEDIIFVKEGTVIEFSPTFAPTEKYQATIKRIARSIDPETRTIQVEADIENNQKSDRIISQMTVRTYIPTVHDESLLAIPETALEVSERSDLVWLVNQAVEAESRSVKVKYIHNGTAFIEEGLTGEEWIITKSPVKIQEYLEVDTTPSS